MGAKLELSCETVELLHVAMLDVLKGSPVYKASLREAFRSGEYAKQWEIDDADYRMHDATTVIDVLSQAADNYANESNFVAENACRSAARVFQSIARSMPRVETD